MVPECRGALISRDEEEALWRQVFTAQPERRREFEPPRVRAELQRSQAATRSLAARYGLNPKTVAKWRRRTSTADARMGPSRPRSSVLTEAEEAVVVEFRRRTLLRLDDVLGCLRQTTIPGLSRSALHRCLRRHGISRLPRGDERASKRGRFAETRIGYVHVDACELRLAQGRLFMFLAIDRVSKFTHVAFYDANTKANGAAFLREVVAAFPYRLHTVLTDNGMAFADLPRNRGRYPEIEAVFGGHVFDRVCDEHGIEHRLTKPYHPWTNGQAERMNRTVKDATIKRPLPRPRGAPGARRGVRDRLQLRQAPQGAAVANALPGQLRRLGGGPVSLQDRPAPPHHGTAHLALKCASTRSLSSGWMRRTQASCGSRAASGGRPCRRRYSGERRLRNPSRRSTSSPPTPPIRCTLASSASRSRRAASATLASVTSTLQPT